VKKNRKKAETYRFNGYPHSNPKSIHSVGISQLESWIKDYEAKLADPNDLDDRKWTARWLQRCETERDKKTKGLILKIRGGAYSV
jgi:hypothetical protein